MKDSRLPALVFLVILVLALLQWVHVYPQLPERMASHFSANGRPNGWQPKQEFFLVVPIVVVVCLVVSFLLPRTLALVPPEMINLPNKFYWLAPERRKETTRCFAAHMAWFGCGLLFVVLNAVSLAINANLSNSAHFDSQGMWYVMAGFCLFAVVLFIHLILHFCKVPESQEPSG